MGSDGVHFGRSLAVPPLITTFGGRDLDLKGTLVIIAIIVGLVAVLGVLLVPERFSEWLYFLAVLTLALGIAGFALLAFGPKDYLMRWPSLTSPQTSALTLDTL